MVQAIFSSFTRIFMHFLTYNRNKAPKEFRAIVWLRNGKLYIPTMVRTVDGLLMSRPPAAVFTAGDKTAIIEALVQRMAHETAVVAPPSDDERDRQSREMLRIYGFKSWSAFMRNALSWDIVVRNDCYVIQGTRKAPYGGLQEDPEQVIVFAGGTRVETVCERMAAILQEAAAQHLRPKEALTLIEPVPITGPVRLPDGRRIDELGDFLEWIANAEPNDETDIRSEIKRYYYDAGDERGGDALNRALDEALAPGITRDGRQKILETYERYTRRAPRKSRR